MDEPVPPNFGEELIETYEEGIHGIKPTIGFMNDQILFLLVSTVMKNKYGWWIQLVIIFISDAVVNWNQLTK